MLDRVAGRLRETAQAVVPWLAVAAVVIAAAQQQGLFSLVGRYAAGPAKAVPLPGGGVFDGDRCGSVGYHHFRLPAGATSPPLPHDAPDGPRLVLGAHGYEQGPRTAARLTFTLLLAPGGERPLELSRTLGADGVAVEIEGSDGLVAGAYGLPVTWREPAGQEPGHRVRLGARDGAIAVVALPVRALCPGERGTEVSRRLQAPIDSHHTITGQPPYTLTVSFSDPGVGRSRASLGSPERGDVLAVSNLIPVGPRTSRV
ncbi:hypothetical protein [Streptomyces cellostaticus]|uniref:hypothetical protein n=1 Tax=Streptomyces cellostaticus TaxID=67285 RepID=UPI0020262152|nr:hypothetical protein [Streptomyces cellostaticus]